MLTYLSAGESHNKGYFAIISGFVPGFYIDIENINEILRLRQIPYGRSSRQKIEQDNIEILSGVIQGRTIGSNITFFIKNNDYQKDLDDIDYYRPGHPDRGASAKYGFKNMRLVAEPTSARNTVIRCAIGALAKQFLETFDIRSYSYTLSIGQTIFDDSNFMKNPQTKLIYRSPVFCPDKAISDRMVKEIDKAKANNDSIGGTYRILIKNVPPGLGDYNRYYTKLDARLSSAVMSVQGCKSVEIGKGFTLSKMYGSIAADRIILKQGKIISENNYSGGIDGGLSNGDDIIIKGMMKPIPMIKQSLQSISTTTKEPIVTKYERSDTCAVPSAALIAEMAVNWEILVAFMEKFDGKSINEIKSNL